MSPRYSRARLRVGGGRSVVEALAAQDGEQVVCEGVVVERIAARNNPPYFVVHGAWRADERIVVICRPPAELMRGHVVDLAGTIQTLPSGERCIVNPTIYARLEKDGGISDRPPLFDSPPVLERRLLSQPTSRIPPSDPSLPDDGLGAPGPVTAWPVDSAWQGASVAQLLTNPPPLLSRVVLSCKPIREIGDSFIVVGDDDTDARVKVYTNHPVKPGDRIVKLIGFAHSENGSLVIYTDAGPSPYYDPQGELGSVVTVSRGGSGGRITVLSDPPEGSIPYARTFSNGNTVTLTSAVVAADGTDFPGALYVQEPDRCAGIRVLYTGSAQIERGDEVRVIGTIGIGDDGERQIDAGSNGVTYIDDHGVPEPLGMRNGSLGGDEANPYSPGITGAYGIYNKGLRVKSWGRVTAVDAGNKCFYIDDGSRLDDGSGRIGVKVSWDWPTAGKAPIMPPVQGWYVSVTGICGSEYNQSQELVRVLRLRHQSDIGYMEDAPGDWPMFMHDPQHTGLSRIWDVAGETLTREWVVDLPTASTERSPRWEYEDEDTHEKISHPNPAGSAYIFEHPYIDSSPVVVGSTVVVGTWTRGTKYPFPGEAKPATGSVKAFDAANNGATLWTATGDPSMGGVASTPCISDGRVYVGTTNGYLYCLDLTTGDQVWARQTTNRSQTPGSSPIISSPVVHDGVVYITNEASKVYAFTADDDGTLVDGYPILLPIDESGHGNSGNGVTDVRQQNICGASSPAIATVGENTYLLVGCDDGWVYRINVSDRSVAGLAMGGCVESSPSVLGNYAYIGVTIYRGRSLHRITIDPLEYAGSWELREESRATPTLAYDYIYNGVDTGTIIYKVRDPNTDPPAEELPQFDAGFHFVGSAACTTGGILYTGNDNGHFYALDADDMTELVSGGYYDSDIQERNCVCSSPAIGYNVDSNHNRWVFITTRSDGGKLYAFKTTR